MGTSGRALSRSIALVALLALPAQASATGRLHEVDVAQEDAGAAVMISCDGSCEYDTYRLHSPERFVFDFSGVTKEVANAVVPGNAHPVRQVRLAQLRSRGAPSARLIVDLEAPATADLEQVPGGILVRFSAERTEASPVQIRIDRRPLSPRASRARARPTPEVHPPRSAQPAGGEIRAASRAAALIPEPAELPILEAVPAPSEPFREAEAAMATAPEDASRRKPAPQTDLREPTPRGEPVLLANAIPEPEIVPLAPEARPLRPAREAAEPAPETPDTAPEARPLSPARHRLEPEPTLEALPVRLARETAPAAEPGPAPEAPVPVPEARPLRSILESAQAEPAPETRKPVAEAQPDRRPSPAPRLEPARPTAPTRHRSGSLGARLGRAAGLAGDSLQRYSRQRLSIATPAVRSEGSYLVLVLESSDRAEANRWKSTLARTGSPAFISIVLDPDRGPRYRVLLGRFEDRIDAVQAAERVNRTHSVAAVVLQHRRPS